MSVAIDLSDKVAVVTGASTGIGRGTALVLARAGAEVVIAGRREEMLQEVVDTGVSGARIFPVKVDLALSDGPARLVAAATAHFGRVDVLVNCAGGSRKRELGASSKLDWDEGMRINYEVPRELSELVLPGMIERRWGRIISVTGTSEPMGINAASPAKAALHVWAKALSREVGVHGITVMCISPGRIDSEQIRNVLYPDPQARVRFAEKNIPLGYFGDPEDVGYLVAFLASSLGHYITGEVIHVDGGMRRYAF